MNKKTVAIVAALLTAIAAAFTQLATRPEASTETASASTCSMQACADLDTAAQKGSYVTATKQTCCAYLRHLALCAALTVGGLTDSACTPPPGPPNPPSALGGAPGVGGASATGGNAATGGTIVKPSCNPATKSLPSPAQIEQWRQTLKPRHKRAAMLRRVEVEPERSAVCPVMWRWFAPWCGNQGNVGGCVAFTAMGWTATQPLSLPFASQDAFNTAALNAYKWITANDPFPGAWPAQDTGSDGGTGCAYLVNSGYAKSCSVPYTEAQVKSALQTRPVMVGMNWLDDMFTPDPCGNLSISGPVVGGHEVLIVGWDGSDYIVQNSWGNGWGVCIEQHCGYFYLKSSDLFGPKLDADFDAPSL